MIEDILIHSAHSFLKLFPIIFGAVILSQVIKHSLSKKKSHLEKIKETSASEATATAIGIATPGPLIGYLPILKELKDKGLKTSIIAAFITGQTLIGPVRLFIETGYFGWKFFAIRVIAAIVTGTLVGLIFKIGDKRKYF